MKKLAAVFVLLLAAQTSTASDLETVRTQFVGYYTAAGADRSTPRMEKALAELEAVTRQITGPDWLRSDGSWIDIDYAQEPAGSWGPWDHSRRLVFMAKAWSTPGHGLYRDPTLLAQIDAALAWTKTFYGATIWPEGNWWFWTIGIPIDLGPTLVLMQGHVDQKTFDDLVLAMKLRIGRSPTSRGLVGPTPTGQNLVWTSFTHMTLAIIERDATRLAAVRDAMASVTRPTSAEGIQFDGSFHQHGAQLYTGGYGGTFANEVARYALITGGTPYALPPASLDSFADFVADGIAWSLHGNHFDVSVVGREVAKPSTTGYNGVAALLQASHFDSSRLSEIRAAAAEVIPGWNGTMPSELAGLAARVESSRYAAAAPSGFRHYWQSDFSVHRRPGWMASVKMFSTRTKSGERTNGENLLGSRQSDGRFHLVLGGDEYFGHNVWPALDWTRLPGTTVEQKADTASDLYGYGTNAFAGGTGDGRNGVAAMQLAPLGSLLTARKAYFFFDDAIVFLTNGIVSQSGNRIETIVNQWPLANTSSQLVTGTDWAALEGIGYWLPASGDLRVSRESRTGTWSALGGSTDATSHTKTFLTMWFDHGTSPMNATAEYAIVPNVTATQMRDWAASQPLAIVANNDIASAVRDTRTGELGITFWRAGSVEGIQATAPAVVSVSGDTQRKTIHAADPNAGVSGFFQLTIPGRWKATGAIATVGPRSTTLLIYKNEGATTSVTLETLMTRRRSVGRR